MNEYLQIQRLAVVKNVSKGQKYFILNNNFHTGSYFIGVLWVAYNAGPILLKKIIL